MSILSDIVSGLETGRGDLLKIFQPCNK